MLSLHHLDHLGATLRQLRLAAGLSQAEVCNRTGLLRPQLSRWENGHDVPTLESLVRFLVATGAGLGDLERALLDAEEEPRRAAVRRELRLIRARHRRRIEATPGLRRLVRRIARPDPEGLERPIPFPASRPQVEAPGGSGVAAIRRELERLVEGLPATLEQILADPAHRRPAVVDQLLERGRSVLGERPRHAVDVAETARLLAAELPETVTRDRRFRLRAESLELWGRSLQAAGEPAAAEAALLCAFELLAQVEDADPEDLAALLRRLAAADSGRDSKEDPAPYAAEAACLTRAAGRD